MNRKVFIFLFLGILIMASLVYGSLILDGDTSYATNDTNVTQETGFAHLNMSEDTIMRYYSFDTNQSTTVFDYSEHGDAAFGSAPIYYDNASCINGGCYYLDGSDDYIDADYQFSTYEFTVAIWVYHSEAIGDEEIWWRDTPFHAADFKLTGAEKPQLRECEEGANIADPTVLPTDTWVHFAITRTGDFFNLYRDAVAVGNNTAVGCDLDTVGGTNIDIGRTWKGLFDEFIIYNRSLNADEIKNIYNNQSHRFNATGELEFNGMSFDINNTANVTLNDCQTLMNSSLGVQFSWSNYTNFSSCVANNVSITGDTNDTNMTVVFNAGHDSFYSPIIISNITIDSYLIEHAAPAPPSDPLVFFFQIIDWSLEWISFEWNSTENVSLGGWK